MRPLPLPNTPAAPTHNRSLILAVASFGGFLVTFMTSSINIALPLIDEEFHISAVTLSWIPLAFILVAGATLLPLGRLSDLYGRMRSFILGMIIFMLFAFASAFAPSAGILIALRAIHGLSLAVGMVTATALVISAYPPDSRGRALGLNVAGIYLGLTLGPVLGGLIIHNVGWRSLFLIIGALGAANLIPLFWKLWGVEWREPKVAPFDVQGSFISAGSLVALLLGFSYLPGVVGAVLIAVGVIGIGGFLWWEARAADPLLHVDLLRSNHVFAFSNLAALINYSATFAMVFLMSLYLQYNRGLNPQTAGFVLVSGTFVQAAFSPLAGRLADRVTARYVAAAGMALCVLGLGALAFLSDHSPYWYIISVLCLLGLGFAFFATPITYSVMGSVRKEQVGIASATIATMRLVGQNVSMGLATLVLAVEVGGHVIQPADYPQVLTSVRVSFLIFAVMCVFGVGASLVGPRRT
ncbi:MAG: MFS transporter [Actinobacteria bacterium]|nr:MFS transporter [Actinomycetota bacterium]